MTGYPHPNADETLVAYLIRTRSIPDLLETLTTGPRPSETAAWGCRPDTYLHCANMALAALYGALLADSDKETV